MGQAPMAGSRTEHATVTRPTWPKFIHDPSVDVDHMDSSIDPGRQQLQRILPDHIARTRYGRLPWEDCSLICSATPDSEWKGIVVDGAFLPVERSKDQQEAIDRGLGHYLLDCQFVTLRARLGVRPHDDDRPAPAEDGVLFDASTVPPAYREMANAVCLDGFQEESWGAGGEVVKREVIPLYSAFRRAAGAETVRLPTLDFRQLNALGSIRYVYIDGSGPDFNTASVWFLARDGVSQQIRGQRLGDLTAPFILTVNLNAWLRGEPHECRSKTDRSWDLGGFKLDDIKDGFREAFDVGEGVGFEVAVNPLLLDQWAAECGLPPDWHGGRPLWGGLMWSYRAAYAYALAIHWLESLWMSDEQYHERGVYRGKIATELSPRT